MDEHEEYYDESEYDEAEDFPEPEEPKKGKGFKGFGGGTKGGKPNIALIAGGAVGVLALTLAGLYFFSPETLSGMLPEAVVGMLPEGFLPAAQPSEVPSPQPVVHHRRHPVKMAAAAPDAAAPDAAKPDTAMKPMHMKPVKAAAQAPDPNSAEWKKPVEIAHAKPAQAAPDEAPAPKAKPHPLKMAHAPRPAPHKMAARPAAASGTPLFTAAVSFAPHSYWVAASEVEKLWNISARAGTHQGHFVVTGHPGRGSDEAELLEKRTEKLADMIRRNNTTMSSNVVVKNAPPVGKSTGWVDVSFVKSL